MTTATKTKVQVQYIVPITVELEVDDMSDDSILDAAWNDLKDKESKNGWVACYGDIKEVVRGADFLENLGDGFYIAHC